MEDTQRTLVILLSMHRSGSSLTANAFMEQGLSLGPWALCPANRSNPHGHFEAIPILEVSLAVQTLIHGFWGDLPETEEAVAAFLATEGRWDDWAEQVPEEYVQRGRSLIRTLLDSGKISGFKDPRTVLLWPFWRRVLSAFPGVRVVPVALLRSPHEIAMSLFTRFESGSGYGTCLDVVAVHFQQLQAIIESWNHPVPRVRFGGPHYFSDLERAVRNCGLDWDPIKAVRVFDESCIHHVPAVVSHRANTSTIPSVGLLRPRRMLGKTRTNSRRTDGLATGCNSTDCGNPGPSRLKPPKRCASSNGSCGSPKSD